jgi:hypothetical protein
MSKQSYEDRSTAKYQNIEEQTKTQHKAICMQDKSSIDSIQCKTSFKVSLGSSGFEH